MTETEIKLVKALKDIADGSFYDASTLAIAGDWRTMYQQLQTIAKTALAEVPNGESQPDLSSVAKRNVFYGSDEYRRMTTAEKCAVQGDGFINDCD